MPLPRFARLDPDKRANIILVASEEFAALGYEKASLNTIIARCGMSKGAMYYYFSDKDDLYETVLDDFLARLFEIWSDGAEYKHQPFDEVETPEAYWEEWIAHYRRSIRHYQKNPVYGEMFHRCLRSRASGTSHAALNKVAEQIREWIATVLKRGEELGAVRKDLPEGLLLDSAFGMLEGFDRWLFQEFANLPEDEIDGIAELVTEFLRRIAEPVSASPAERRS
jgi:AcrR family transcriptional regulator